MAIAYLDTSAVVKRYDTREAGSARILELCDPRVGNTLILADITSPEVAAALARKVLRREISQRELMRMWRQFVDHRDTDYGYVHLEQHIYRRAELLALRRTLRAYDAVQLACALAAQNSFGAAEFIFVTGDRRLATVAQAEGLDVEPVG